MNSICRVHDRAAGWLISFAVHAAGIVVASIIMTDLHLAPQPEPFRWEVSMAQPPAPKSSVAPPLPPPVATPPQKVSPPSRTAQNSIDRPVPQVVETQKIVRNVQTVTHVEQQQIRRNVEPSVQTEDMPTEVPQPQETQVRQVESIHQTVETQFIAAQSPSPTVAEPIIERSSHVVEETSSPVTQEPVQSSQAMPFEAQSSITEQSVKTIETVAVERHLLPVEHTRVESPTVEAQNLPPVTEPVQQAPIQQAAIQNNPPRHQSSRKVDYAWLVEALSNRVGQFKKYPFMARTNRWEGLVVLRATINSEGKLVDVAVIESSGHALLDQDAMEVMRKSCPLHLEHPLGRPQVEIQVPISYKLR